MAQSVVIGLCAGKLICVSESQLLTVTMASYFGINSRSSPQNAG